MKCGRDEEYIPLCRIKIKTNEDGRIHEEIDIGTHGEVEPRFLHRVSLESKNSLRDIMFDESMGAAEPKLGCQLHALVQSNRTPKLPTGCITG
jgi:hypothetical protein